MTRVKSWRRKFWQKSRSSLKEEEMTDIGRPIKKWEVLPLEEPVDDPPIQEPAEPIKVPEGEPEKVPV